MTIKQYLSDRWTRVAAARPVAGDDARPRRPGLLVFENDTLAAVVPLGPAPVSVGRDPGCVIRPTSGEVSRIHCSIQLVDAAVVVTDLDSTNGTYRFGQKIRREVLRPGDEIAVGRALIKLVDLDSRTWSVHTGLYEE